MSTTAGVRGPIPRRDVWWRPRKLVFRSRAASGQSVPEFGSGEHAYLGDTIPLNIPNVGDFPQAGQYTFTMPNGATATYGQIIAMADFFGIPSQPISTSTNREAQFMAVFNQMATDPSSPDVIAKLNSYINIETTAIQAALQAKQPPSVVLTSEQLDLLSDYMATVGNVRFMQLVANNIDHFGQQALIAWQVGHTIAVNLAAQAQSSTDPTPLLLQAFMVNAFAAHFLTDLFSAGHIRTPRMLLHSFHSIGDWAAKLMHDEDSYNGLQVINANGTQWQAFGDNFLLDGKDVDNFNQVQEALKADTNEINTTFASGWPPASFAALAYIPTIGTLPQLTAPLFVETTEGLAARHPCGSTTSPKTRNIGRTWELVGVIRDYEASPVAREVGAPWLDPFDQAIVMLAPKEVRSETDLCYRCYASLLDSFISERGWKDPQIMGTWSDTQYFLPVDPIGEGYTSILVISEDGAKSRVRMMQFAPDQGGNGTYTSVWGSVQNDTAAALAWLPIRFTGRNRTSFVRFAVTPGQRSYYGFQVWKPRWTPKKPLNGYEAGARKLHFYDNTTDTLAWVPLDLQGDGGTDVIQVLNAPSLTMYVYWRGKETFERPSANITEGAAQVTAGSVFAAGDIDGNGVDELLVLNNTGASSCTVTAVWPLAAAPVTSTVLEISNGPMSNIAAFDMNADGLDEVLIWNTDGSSAAVYQWTESGWGSSPLWTGSLSLQPSSQDVWKVANPDMAGRQILLHIYANGQSEVIVDQWQPDIAQGAGLYNKRTEAKLASTWPTGAEFFLGAWGYVDVDAS